MDKNLFDTEVNALVDMIVYDATEAVLSMREIPSTVTFAVATDTDIMVLQEAIKQVVNTGQYQVSYDKAKGELTVTADFSNVWDDYNNNQVVTVVVHLHSAIMHYLKSEGHQENMVIPFGDKRDRDAPPIRYVDMALAALSFNSQLKFSAEETGSGDAVALVHIHGSQAAATEFYRSFFKISESKRIERLKEMLSKQPTLAVANAVTTA